jgi:hypothetical protein
MVAWGMIDVPHDIYAVDFVRIEEEVWRELYPTALRIYPRHSTPTTGRVVYIMRQVGGLGEHTHEGTLRECCQKAVEILDAAKTSG